MYEAKRDGTKEGLEQGKEVGKKESKIKITKKIIDKGLSVKEILEITEFTEEEIKTIK